MKLDALAAVVRPRRSWEAIDLGFAMARQWWRGMIIAWLAITLPFFVVLNVLLLDNLLWAPVIFWLLKPWFDHIPLYVVSRALFGEMPTPKQTIKAFPGLLSGQILSSITFRRFNPARSFYLPLWQLERLTGKAYRQRAEILGRNSHGDGIWLTVICLHFESLIMIGCFVLLYLLLPANLFDIDFMAWLEDESVVQQLFSNFMYYIAITLIEPFYVSAGFSLYLNRRTLLEAWDIELSFRHLRERLQARQPVSER